MPEEMMTCPYDSAHRIARHRMPYHLVKCKKKYDCAREMQSCPFNAIHVVPKERLKDHIQACPDYLLQL